VNWQTTADGHHCTRHNVSFRRGQVCRACATDPGEIAVPTTSEDADDEILRDAGEYQSHGRKLWRRCEDLLDGTDLEKNIAAKLSAEAAKWERLSIETKDRVAARKQLREAMAHERRMQRGSH
jgi:hypothetical protein